MYVSVAMQNEIRRDEADTNATLGHVTVDT